MDLDDIKGLVISVVLMILIYLWQNLWSKIKSRFSREKPQPQPRERVFTPMTMSVEMPEEPEIPAPAQPFENPDMEGVRAVETPKTIIAGSDAQAKERQRRRRRLAQTIVAGEILRPRFKTFNEI